jgi:hypothetical protein
MDETGERQRRRAHPTADGRVALADQHRDSGARQYGRGGETIRTRSHDDGVSRHACSSRPLGADARRIAQRDAIPRVLPLDAAARGAATPGSPPWLPGFGLRFPPVFEPSHRLHLLDAATTVPGAGSTQPGRSAEDGERLGANARGRLAAPK